MTTTSAIWNKSQQTPCIVETVKTRIKNWEYTENGWFIYEVCVPEEPEVTEVVNGNEMIRVLPVNAKYRELERQYLIPVSYLGNNLFSADWDDSNKSSLDCTGLYERFCQMNTGQDVDPQQLSEGISKDDFENTIKTYLDISAEEINAHTVFDTASGKYRWRTLSCGNYTPDDLGSCIPEIREIRKNGDGTETWTVDAVCKTAGTEALFTHELTVKQSGNGQIRYLSNKVTAGQENIPAYEYRV